MQGILVATPDVVVQKHAEPAYGERRQVTIMFCDLVDSTALARALDPEDLREVYRIFRDAVAGVIRHHDGYIASFLGDGIVAFFGYPQAREDDAERGVRAGLDVLAAVRGIRSLPDVTLQARVGITTGLVVLGDLTGTGAPPEKAAVGEATNLAARLQGETEPDSMLISDDTRRLIGNLFECVDGGSRRMKGYDAPVRVWKVLRERPVEDRFEAIHAAADLVPLVGRTVEQDTLLERWNTVRAGSGQIVSLIGEAGVGKSRLVHALREHGTTYPRNLLRYFCAPRFQNTALYPVITQIQREADFSQSDPPAVKLDKLEALLLKAGYREPATTVAPYIASLLSLPFEGRYRPIVEGPERLKKNTLSALTGLISGLAQNGPVLAIFEDLHWSDPSTVELIGQLVNKLATLPLMIVTTTRPGVELPWNKYPGLLLMELARLDRDSSASIVSHLASGKSLPAPIVEQILDKSDGIPLFIEELTRTVLESEQIDAFAKQSAPTGALPMLSVPSTLRDSLMARLDRLPSAREIVQASAAIGREFSLELLAAVLPVDKKTLDAELQRLIDANLILSVGTLQKSAYVFKHALIQDAAHATLLRSARHDLHRRIAETLENSFPETVDAQPELLAYHYSEAGLVRKAIDYLRVAAYQAVTRSANQEARNHIYGALEFLLTMPETLERKKEELELYTMLGPVLAALKGYAAADVAETYARAEALQQEVEDPSKAHAFVRGKFQVALLQARYSARHSREQSAEELIEELGSLADRHHDMAYRTEVEIGRGVLVLFLGKFKEARRHLDLNFDDGNSGLFKNYSLRYGIDVEASCLAYRARALWFLGFCDQALELGGKAVSQAKSSAISLSIAQSMGMLAMIHQVRGEVDATRTAADQTIGYSNERGHPYWVALASIVKGWALAQDGHAREGIDLIRRSLDAYKATGAKLGNSSFLVQLAEAYQLAGQLKDGLQAVDEALGHVEQTGERYFEAEALRRKGELMLAVSGSKGATEAQKHFERALQTAEAQNALSWALRAATSLARLRVQQGERRGAFDLLATYRQRISEGSATADLRIADHILDSLGSSPSGELARPMH
ncbi:MAG: AAA family ATPase [Burkholderiales bacterium]